MTAAALNVWNQVVEAFPPVLPAQPVTRCDCEECGEVRTDLGNLRWTEVLPPAVEREFGALVLLTAEAFQALLPAYLFHSLRDLSVRNRCLEFTLYALCGPYEGGDEADFEELRREADTGMRERIRNVTAGQRAAVRAFLSLAASVAELKYHREAITHALSAVWDEPATEARR